MTKSDEQRFWEKVDKSGGEEACWLWGLSLTKNGYPQFRVNSNSIKAHRIVYEKYYGEIPIGGVIRWNCNNRLCVNPKHLLLSSRIDKHVMIPKFWSLINKSGECWLWTKSCDKDGYGKFWFNYKGIKACKMAYVLTCGEVPDGMCVLHKCDNPPCCRPDHLYLGTQADNVMDRMNRGRQRRGEAHPLTTLSDRNVLDIRRRFIGGRGEQTNLAFIYNVSLGVINRIVRRKTWTHI